MDPSFNGDTTQRGNTSVRSQLNGENARTSTSAAGKGTDTNVGPTSQDNKGFVKALNTLVGSWATHKDPGRQWTTEMDHRLLGLKCRGAGSIWPIIAEIMGVPKKACKKRYEALLRAEWTVKFTKPQKAIEYAAKRCDIPVDVSEDLTDEAKPDEWGLNNNIRERIYLGGADAWSNGNSPEDWCFGNEPTCEHTWISMSAQEDNKHSTSAVDETSADSNNSSKHCPNCGCQGYVVMVAGLLITTHVPGLIADILGAFAGSFPNMIPRKTKT
jgi:hypothetical protein